MSRGSELAAAVCRDPSDIESRLVYGDWLLENGDPRGTFVLQHCKLETMTGLEDEYAELRASTERLEAAHARGWLGEYAERLAMERSFSKIEVSPLFNPVFRHGFLYRIAGRASDIAEQWPWLREREPIAGMELLVHESVSDVEGIPPVAEWRTLKISPDDWFTAASFADVLRWGLPAIREIDLTGCDIGDSGCGLLTNGETQLASYDDWTPPPRFADGQLDSLILRTTQIGDAGAIRLFDAATLSGLTELDVSQCRLKEAATLESLRASEVMIGLRRLTIAGNKELGGQLAALSGWTALPKLARLGLPQTVTAEDVSALFPAPSAELRELDVAAAKGLLATPGVVAAAAEALTSINVGMTRLGDGGLAELIAAPSLRRVHALLAYGCSLSDSGVESILESDLDSIVTLDLSSNKLSDKSLAALAAWPGLRTVTRLRLANNRKLTSAGYGPLIDAEHFEPVTLDVGKLKGEIAPLRARFDSALTYA